MKYITSGEGEMFLEICRGGRRAIGYRDRLKTAAQSTDDKRQAFGVADRLGRRSTKANPVEKLYLVATTRHEKRMAA